ncbi:glycoside hydrolase family 16 protein [Portibacter marinus]|uniref:glycoside hydrolase family 16 protein n=1 Tax=Portibacter marinus TaxID=2898660 RepID=UPI001F1BEC63|nr:glycoside hydrolase family 16 protein [Portibacter marinus]
MNKIYQLTVLFIAVCITLSCEDNMVETPEDKPILTISNSEGFENTSNPNLIFEITISEALNEDLEIPITVEGLTAEPGVDFKPSDENALTLPAGQLKVEARVEIINDQLREVDEKLKVIVGDMEAVEIQNDVAIGIIKDGDEAEVSDPTGYQTDRMLYGYDLVWEEDFTGSTLNEEFFNYELGDNGWGNNELQNYTNDQENAFVENSNLTIRAKDLGGKYTSARLTTQDKKEFKFGRIDVRAKLPKGQGIWPAIWMLGENIDEVSWPACGEIDIMELVGHQPKTVHGTAHWGLRGEASTYKTSSKSIADNFADAYHVFSIVWEFNQITWYLDEEKFHSIDASQTQGKPYPFNNEFFFILNIAVGGNWPGSPDETTEFPQEMNIDYIRVFQEIE